MNPNNPAGGLVTSKDWTLDYLLASGSRFRAVDTISTNSDTPEQIASRIKDYERRNVPLVVQDLNCHPDWPGFFTPQWLETHCGSQMVEVRNVHGERIDRKSSVTDLINSLRNIPRFAQQEERERLYGKDMYCPAEWRTWIKTSGILPDAVKPGATGDILPETVETLMSYLGVSDTFTPLHKDPCASYGQNIMCYAEDGGSSFWFMTNPQDCGTVIDYFQRLGHELDWEDHVATLEELAQAPFDVYIWEQKIGDLVLIPPRSFHQVVNAGGITIKVSWSRMSIRSLELALYHELPIYRRVCRPEIYRVKRTIYDTLVQRTAALETLVHDTPDSTFDSVNPLGKEVARLIELLDDVLEQEFSTQHRRLRQVTNSFAPGGHGDVCDFCGADIFLSSFQCDSCSPESGSGDPICLCPTCVVEGRTCKCRGMEPVQSGSFRELLRNRNNAMLKLREAHEAGFYEEEPEVLSDQHLLESVTTTFQAAWLLLEKRRDILNSQKTTRTCTVKRTKSHVVDGWAIIICKGCRSGKCFVHILEVGIHSSEALMTVGLDESYERWHSIHNTRQKRYEDAVPGLLWATKVGDKTAIDHRLVYFARTFQTPRPLSQQVTLGFYDKKLPDPEEVDQLDPVSAHSESTNSRIGEETPVQRLLRRLDSDSPAVSGEAEATSRKRKRPSKPLNSKAEPDRPSQPPMDDPGSERLPQIPRSSKRLIMDCVLITTLPPKPRRKIAPPEKSGDGGNRSHARARMRGREKQPLGKRREVATTSRASVHSDSRSLADESMRSQSHSVSSIRPPLFEPETSPSRAQADSDPIEVEESVVEIGAEEVDDSDDQKPLSFVSHRRKRVESGSPASPVDLPPPSSSLPSPHPEKLPYYTVVSVKRRLPGPGVRFAPHQREIAKTPASIYHVHRPVAGPSHQTAKVGPPKPRLPNRPEPKLRPVAELNPPRPPPPPPGLTALEVRMETKMNAFADENQKLRDELLTVRNELAAAKSDLATALTRVGTMEHDLHELETLGPKLGDVEENYERLSKLLRGEHLFDSEKFRSAIQTEVKNAIGYYWPSLRSDMKAQLWKDFPGPVKDYMEKEMGKVADEIVLIRSDLATLQHNSVGGGSVQNGDAGIAELKQTMERIEKRQEELEAAVPKTGETQESERARRASTSSVPGLTPNNAGNMLPSSLPPKPPSPWLDNPQQSPHRRGAQTPPTASGQNSRPVHQDPDDAVNDPMQTGPSQDPRRSPALPRSSFTLPPRPFNLKPISLSSVSSFRTASERLPPSTSAPPTPTLPQPFPGMHPSRVAQLETDALGPAIINHRLPFDNDTTSMYMPRSESTLSIPPKPFTRMHPDRTTFLSASDQYSSATSIEPRPHVNLNDLQQRLPPEERLVDRKRSLPTPFGTVPLRDGPVPSSSRITLDDLVTSPASEFPNHIYPTPSNYRIPAQTHKHPNQSPNQSKRGKAAQKRKAFEALPSPKPKMRRVERGRPGNGNNNTGGSEAAQVNRKASKKWKKKNDRMGRGKPNGQPGPSKSRRDDPDYDQGRSYGMGHTS